MNEKIRKASYKLQELHELTDSETSVVCMLTQGRSPLQIAEHRERSIETVRTQIKHVMHKLNVNRVSAIVSKVYALVDY